MSPRKEVKNLTSKRKVTRNLKRTVVEGEPKLNMPTNIKVSIPLKRAGKMYYCHTLKITLCNQMDSNYIILRIVVILLRALAACAPCKTVFL